MSERYLEALKGSPYWTTKTRISGNTIQKLRCPACDDLDAWAYASGPMSINCNRLSQCGARTKTINILPELRRNIERDFPPTKADPHRPAREYLLSRGLSAETIDGLDYRYLKNARNTGSGAVMFAISKDTKGKETMNGRLFCPPPGEGKTHNAGTTAGKFWKHPGRAYDPDKRTWLVEGIIDALSLWELGEQAIAILAAGQSPAKVDLSDFKNLVISFDPDDAGKAACRKWHQAHPEAAIVLCDHGQDWNDFLLSGPIDTVKAAFTANFPRYETNGKLALAATAQEYAKIWTDFHGTTPGIFIHLGRTYHAVKRIPRGGKPENAYVATSLCFRGTLRVTTFIVDRSNPARPEYRYNLEIKPTNGKTIEATASGPDLASQRRIKEWFLTYTKMNFEGEGQSCTALATIITEAKAPEVKLLSYTGYQPESGAHIFAGWGIDHSGKPLYPDKQGVFTIGHNQHFRAPAHATEKAITPIEGSKEKVATIYGLIREAWGLNGTVALSWTVAGWFVHQIKSAIDFFPFLSIYGDPAAGKSALVRTLNAIQARDTDGQPINQQNTRKGISREIGKASGLFIALLEDNQRNEKSFDYSVLLTGYNRGPLSVQAAFSNDLQTKEQPFLGSLLFVQNNEPFISKAEKQRVISLQCKSDDLTDTSRKAYSEILDMRKGELADILRQVLTNRQHFENGWQAAYSEAMQILGDMDERRILQNHALILGFHHLFCTCFGIDQDPAVVNHLRQLGRKKCISSAMRRTTLADYFFELADGIDNDKLVDAYHLDEQKGHIYVNLPRVENLIRNKGISFQVTENLSKALQDHPAFLKNSFKYRFPNDPERDQEGRTQQRRVWVFDMLWFKQNSAATIDPEEAA